ncbi:MAG: hypothetical protein KDD46_02790 [Bdellovibrionales bacterium]|nr:hypothetical protein [Bdellovibrionales bacterium]
MKWVLRSVPFFLVTFFVFINLIVFTLQPRSYFLQSMHGWDPSHAQKQVRLTSFQSIYGMKYMSEMISQLQIYYSAKDDYPRKLEDLHIHPKNKNWIYKPTFKNYDLIYKSDTQ